ncbi:hypothetical protein NG895_07185 [Aeoliella sp. ICT_H6.2]|uniref:Tetratricopeptide repeat protein n=1 Tax=Aeoliella straminimaris TaxID=2954799 RepID=A0A9X2FD77_9BACT|nr:hypothetical protein [Aeoliella straminimaris]MCO6043686.1 hypothetical protein [Aeoliella straminimaris]
MFHERLTICIEAPILAALCLIVLSLAGCGQRNSPEQQPATRHFLAAQEALAKGDKEAAIRSFTASIDAKPNGWAYMERAKLYLDQGNDEAAIADCEAGLAIEPKNEDFKWLLAEAKKPANDRFKGKFAQPPSAKK